MECLEKPVWNSYTEEELRQLTIPEPDDTVRERVYRKWDSIAKPIDGLGRFEKLIAQIGAVTGTEKIEISKKALIILCADNGIVEEGVSQCGQEVTAAVARAMAKGCSAAERMAAAAGADTIPVDIGINSSAPMDGIWNKRVRRGTRNFRKEPAMTEQEAIAAIAAGIDIVYDCKKKGYQLLATGEMGIGNTTTSSAVTAALLKRQAEEVTGRGAGLSEEGLLRKKQLIEAAIEQYALYQADALTILKSVGGLDIAGLAGVCIGGALCRLPVVLDGVISMAAALLAERLCPGVKDYLLPSHRGKEPAAGYLAEALSMKPVIDGELALGEGSGAVMLFPLLDLALEVYRSETDFGAIQIERYRRWDEEV